MVMLRPSRIAVIAALAALAFGGYRLAGPARAETETSEAARTWRGEVRKAKSVAIEGFHPARCIGEPPPAQLLALADWPLDVSGRTCVGEALDLALDPVLKVEVVEDLPPVIRVDIGSNAPGHEYEPFEGPPPGQALELAAATEGELDELRGGFELPGGLVMSFGIERLVYINGNLVSTTRVNLAELGELVGAGAPLAAGTTVALIQNGPNNTAAEVLTSGALATVIQNSLNDQRIQAVTTINARVNSLELLRVQRFTETLRDAVRLQQ
jgi:hypothetical protein